MSIVVPEGPYDEYSIEREGFPEPHGCWVYEPDNHDDYQCLVIWQPAPELGAQQWTLNGQRVLIGVYRDEGRPGFYETNIVFRLLPSFKLVTIATVLEILHNADPNLGRKAVALTNIASGDIELVSEVILKSQGSVAYRKHRQQFDELMRPLRQEYDAKGNVIPPKLRFSKHANASLYLTPPLVDQYVTRTANDKLPAHDYYGFELPVAAAHYDEDEPNGIGGDYDGIVHDVFGDFVVGARVNNTLITRQPVQPIKVDHHNTPLKRALRRG